MPRSANLAGVTDCCLNPSLFEVDAPSWVKKHEPNGLFRPQKLDEASSNSTTINLLKLPKICCVWKRTHDMVLSLVPEPTRRNVWHLKDYPVFQVFFFDFRKLAVICSTRSLHWTISLFFLSFSTKELRQDPLEAILVIFGRRALIFFAWKLLEKSEKWHQFCAHAQWWSPWRRKNVEKGHLAPSNLTFLLIAIDRNGFRRVKEKRVDLQNITSEFLIFA